MFAKAKKKGFQILALHHAEAILKYDMPDAAGQIEEALLEIEIPVEELIRGGGGEGKVTQRMRNFFAQEGFGWKKHNFQITKTVDGVEKESTSHEIDHVKHFAKGVFALEIEWNNKDPFFDRDLENFKRLHADGAVSVAAIITRGKSLHDALPEIITDFAVRNQIDSVDKVGAFYNPTPRQKDLFARAAKQYGSFEKGWAHAFTADKFGEATTHWRKLEDRVKRGVGNPCPLLLIGIPKQVIVQ